MRNRVRSGYALYAGVIAVAGLSVFWAGMSFRAGRKSTWRVNEPSPLALAMTMTQCGLGAQELTAAGVAPDAICSVVTAARAAMIDNNLDFAQLQLSVASARQVSERLEMAVRSGDASIDTIADRLSARSTLSNAESQLAAARTTVQDAVADLLTNDANSKLAAIHIGFQGLPLKYRLVSRSEADGVALRNALANQRIATACGESPHYGCNQSIAAASSDPAVADAEAALATHGAEVSLAWKQAVGLR